MAVLLFFLLAVIRTVRSEVILNVESPICPLQPAKYICTSSDTGTLRWNQDAVFLILSSLSTPVLHTLGEFSLRLIAINDDNVLDSSAVMDVAINGSIITCSDRFAAPRNSTEIEVIVDTTKPSNPPRMIEAALFTINSCTLSWIPPAEDFPCFDHYVITVEDRSYNVSSTTFTVPDLTAGAEYQVYIASANMESEGASGSICLSLTAPSMNFQVYFLHVDNVTVMFELSVTPTDMCSRSRLTDQIVMHNATNDGSFIRSDISEELYGFINETYFFQYEASNLFGSIEIPVVVSVPFPEPTPSDTPESCLCGLGCLVALIIVIVVLAVAVVSLVILVTVLLHKLKKSSPPPKPVTTPLAMDNMKSFEDSSSSEKL